MASELIPRNLGDFFALRRGTTYKSELLGLPGPILLGLATIQRNGGFRSDNLQTYGGESPNKLLVKPGELYVSLKDVTQSADLLGAVARLPADFTVGRLTQDTVKLEPQRENLPLEFLYWLLRTPQYREYCRSRATGTTNLGLGREDFLSFPVPQLGSGQRLIVSILEAIESKIELNRKMNETLQAMARALFKSWFVDFDPVRAKAEGRDPGLPSPIAALFPDSFEDSELGEIPKGWKAESLTQFASLNPESWTRRTRPKSIEYVDLSNVKWGRIDGRIKYADTEAPSRAQRVLRPGDTIIGTVRPGNGSYAQIAEEGLTGSTGFAVLRPAEESNSEFVYLAATSPENIDRLAHVADGGAYPAVRPEVVASQLVPSPDPSTLAAFSRLTAPLLKGIAQNEKQSQSLSDLRDSLLPKLISGEIRISSSVRGTC